MGLFKKYLVIIIILNVFSSCKKEVNNVKEKEVSFVEVNGKKLDISKVYFSNFGKVESSNNFDTLVGGVPVFDFYLTISDGSIIRSNFNDSFSDDLNYLLDFSFCPSDTLEKDIIGRYLFNPKANSTNKNYFEQKCLTSSYFVDSCNVEKGNILKKGIENYYIKSATLNVNKFTKNLISLDFEITYNSNLYVKGKLIDFPYTIK